MRALFRPFVLHAAYTPIETIVFFCIIGTLAYFHILSAIKHSTFLDPTHAYGAPVLLWPAHVVYKMGEWVGVREGAWNGRVKAHGNGSGKDELVVELQQVIFTLGSTVSSPPLDHSTQQVSLSTPPLSTSTLNLTKHLTSSAFQTPSGWSYNSLCHRAVNHSECFTVQQPYARTFVHTLAFRPGGFKDEWVSTLLGEEDGSHQHQVLNFEDEAGVKFVVDKTRMGAEPVPLTQMRNGKWVAYALRALVVRFWDLAKKADSLDILLILAGYILMHTTFYLLLTRSRALGSSFFLPLAILSSSVLSLLIALPIAMALKIHIDPVALTEALPFLVCTVGFDKPLRLARAVFGHPHLSVPPALVPTTLTPSGYPVPAPTLAPPPALSATHQWHTQLKPAPKIITESLSHVYKPVVRDYALEICVLCVGAWSRVGGLREVCALAAVILAVDCLLMTTYLAAILGVMVEVRRIKTTRAMTRSRSNSVSSIASTSMTSSSGTAIAPTPPSAMAQRPPVPQPKTLRQRVKSTLLGGEKGAGLPGFGEVVVKGRRVRVSSKGMNKGKGGKVVDGKGMWMQKENPVARLKLLLITSFLILHILNFITPLTPSKHTHSSSSSAVGANVNVRKVDITAPGLRAVLSSLVEAEGIPAVADESNVDEDGEMVLLGKDSQDLWVKVSPPVYVRVLLPPSMLGVSSMKHTSTIVKQLSALKTAVFSSNYIPAASRSIPSKGKGKYTLPVSPSTLPSSSSSSASELLEAFMSSWTRLVGDPILSKWIVVMLALSVMLNGYLLKGIAAGLVGAPGAGARAGASGPWATAFGGVRFEGVGNKGEESDGEAEPEVVGERRFAGVSAAEVRPKKLEVEVETMDVERTAEPESPTALAAPPAIGTFSLEDVDRKLKAAVGSAKPPSRRLTITSASVAAAGAAAALRNAPSASSSSNTIVASHIHPTPPSSSSDNSSSSSIDAEVQVEVENIRTLEECVDIFDNGPRPLSESLALLNDEEVILLAQNGKIAAYALEKVLGMNELERAVRIRRALISRASKTQTLESSDIPVTNYDYSRVLGACCENVVGYIPLPLGIAGPLNIDGALFPIPMATAEGTLVASTSRGCKALNAGGGVTTVLTQDAMTRGPAIDFPSVTMAADAKMWIDSEDGFATIKESFESTSRFARLQSLKTAMAGRTLFVRFATATGDAMGMNMISKGTEKALETMQRHYPEMVVLALSGNYCTDKKPAAINWIEGRGKSVVAEAVVPGRVVKTVLKTTVASLVNLNTKKNLVGSAMAGSIGGFNAHAANILTAIFLATGQDPAQNVESSMCMTLMEPINDGQDLLMTVSMPCIEVGTIGGGTVLGPQQSVLEMLGMKGAHPTHPGHNAQALARLIAAAVMAGELSLLSALAAGHLIRAHMAHNRSQTNTPAPSVPPTPGLGGGMVLKMQAVVAPPQSAEDKGKKASTSASGSMLGPLTPSSSTASLPPYSQ